MVKEYRRREISGPDSYPLELDGHPIFLGEQLRNPDYDEDNNFKLIRLKEPERIRGVEISEFLVSEIISVIYLSRNGNPYSKKYPIVKGYPNGMKHNEKNKIIFIVDGNEYIPKKKHHIFGRKRGIPLESRLV